jgi:hypothetical protein
MFILGSFFSLIGFFWIIPSFGGSGTPYVSRLLPFGVEVTSENIARFLLQWSTFKQYIGNFILYNSLLGLPFLFIYLIDFYTIIAILPVVILNSIVWWSVTTVPFVSHYSAPIVAWLFIGSIRGYTKLKTFIYKRVMDWRPNYSVQRVLGVAIGTSFAVNQLFYGYTPFSLQFRWPQETNRNTSAQQIISRIPENEAVSAEAYLAGHLGKQQIIRFFPDDRDVNWILMDVWQGMYLYSSSLDKTIKTWYQYINNPDWKTVVAQDGFILLAKGQGPPQGLSEAFKPTSSISTRPMVVQFQLGDKKLQLIGANLLQRPTGQTFFCTDWKNPNMDLSDVTVQLHQAKYEKINSELFLPSIFQNNQDIRDCSLLGNLTRADEDFGIVVRTSNGDLFKMTILDPGDWRDQIRSFNSELVICPNRKCN